MKTGTKNIGAKAALFGAALIWGSSFLIVKNSMDALQPNLLIAIRFTIALLVLSILFAKRLKNIDRYYIKKGGIIGFFLFLGYTLQTIGITDTTPGKNAFLTAVYCVLVPFMYWAVDKKKPDTYNILAAFTAIFGIGLVSLNGDFSIGMGDALTLASGVAYGGQVVAITKYGKDKDPILLTIVQFAYTAILSWIVVIVFHQTTIQWSSGLTISILYISVFSTAVAILLQNIGQKYTKPAPAALILSLESVFGVLFSVAFYHEVLTLRLILGFVLIFLAIIISETKLGFLSKRSGEELAQENTL